MRKFPTILGGLCRIFIVAISVAFLFRATVVKAETRISPVAVLADRTERERLKFELSKAIHEGRIKPDEFEKLDFTMPDDLGFGDNVEYEVFNSDSPRTVMLAKEPFLPLFQQGLIDMATTVPGTRPFFNLRRIVTEKHGMSDAIVIVIPNIDLSKCQLPKAWSLPILRLEHPLEFHTDLSTIANDPHRLSGCLQAPDGNGYLMLPLVQREKAPKSGKWRFYYNYIAPREPKAGKK